jgi:hypothetical protein
VRFGEKGVAVDLKAREMSGSGEQMSSDDVTAANHPFVLAVANKRYE